MQGHGDIIVGLDIGTTKICAVVGEISGSDIKRCSISVSETRFSSILTIRS